MTSAALAPLQARQLPAVHGVLQRCGPTPCDCPDRDDGGSLLRRFSAGPQPGHAPDVPPIVHDVLRSPGQPLADDVRALYESRFGYDFSGVRVHTDARAASSAGEVGAAAYTIGQHVVFATGAWAPHSRAGRELLAHELAHTIQQRGAPASGLEPVRISDPADSSERSADLAARRFSAGPAPVTVAAGGGTTAEETGGTLQRQAPPSKGKPKDKERETPCTPRQKELISKGIADGSALADEAATAMGRLTYPGRGAALRKHFGDVSNGQEEAIRGRFERIRDALTDKVTVCLDHCIKSARHRIECARGQIPGKLIQICPAFGGAACDPGVTMLHEAAHNDGARGDVDTTGDYPPKKNPEDNAYSYENFASDIRKGPPEPQLRPKKDEVPR